MFTITIKTIIMKLFRVNLKLYKYRLLLIKDWESSKDKRGIVAGPERGAA
jgi:hypothetical protein